MRKRIIIAVTAAAVIGVGVCIIAVLSGPKRGTVEYHKTRVIEIMEKAEGKSLWRKVVRKATGIDDMARPNYERLEAELVLNLSKLEELGYLEWRHYQFTNRPLTEELIQPAVMELLGEMSEQQMFFQAWDAETNVLKVRAAREDLVKWEQLVRKLDVPENGK